MKHSDAIFSSLFCDYQEVQSEVNLFFNMVKQMNNIEIHNQLRYEEKYLGELKDIIHSADDVLDGEGGKSDPKMCGESISVIRCGENVWKFRRLTDLCKGKLQQIFSHNRFFGERTLYSIAGWAIREDLEHRQCETLIVLQQPFINFSPDSGAKGRELLQKDLEHLFGPVEKQEEDGDWYIARVRLHLDDLKKGNIGIDKMSGQYAVVDCLIYENSDRPNIRPTGLEGIDSDNM